MGKMTQVVIGLIMVAVLMVIFPIVMSSTHELQTDVYTDEGLDLVAQNGTWEITLEAPFPWNDAKTSIISVVGDKPETLTVDSYVKPVLTVTGVTTSTTADVTYEIDALTSYTGMGALVGITPLLIWIAVLATVIGGIWFAVKGRG